MKKIYILLFAILIGFSTQSQNIFQNSFNWEDLNGDNIGDGWYVNGIPSIDLGYQYSQNFGTAGIGQVVNIPNPKGKLFQLQYLLNSNEVTQVYTWITPTYGVIQSENVAKPNGINNHFLQFVYNKETIYAIEFRTFKIGPVDSLQWIRIDNVVLNEVVLTDVVEHQPRDNTGQVMYYNIIGEPLSKEPDHGYYIKRVGSTSTKYCKP